MGSCDRVVVLVFRGGGLADDHPVRAHVRHGERHGVLGAVAHHPPVQVQLPALLARGQLEHRRPAVGAVCVACQAHVRAFGRQTREGALHCAGEQVVASRQHGTTVGGVHVVAQLDQVGDGPPGALHIQFRVHRPGQAAQGLRDRCEAPLQLPHGVFVLKPATGKVAFPRPGRVRLDDEAVQLFGGQRSPSVPVGQLTSRSDDDVAGPGS